MNASPFSVCDLGFLFDDAKEYEIRIKKKSKNEEKLDYNTDKPFSIGSQIRLHLKRDRSTTRLHMIDKNDNGFHSFVCFPFSGFVAMIANKSCKCIMFEVYKRDHNTFHSIEN